MKWTISQDQLDIMIESCIKGFPFEACGLLIGPVDGDGIPHRQIDKVWPSINTENSAQVYSIDPQDMYHATQYAMKNNLDIIGVYHSHTHSKAYPSQTDISKALSPHWCYAIISLAQETIDTKYYKISNDDVEEIECSSY